ncbi:ATP-binding protein [Pseudomonas sp. NPDC007930]|uniref:sensor histidine kinase n=1 Tax=Pseudomonas sp. NPDC007930 TaxID=3364417 RepID=UPI0036E1E479
MPASKHTELEQASVRLFVAGCSAIYVLVVALLPGSELASFIPVLLYIGFFLSVSIWIRKDIKSRPGHFPLRRALEMLHDYTAITLVMVVGGEVALPLFAVLLWVTVGNALRFGPRDLLLATLCALTSLAVAWGNTPLWQAHPFMPAAMALSVLAVPAYALFLAREAHQLATEQVRASQEQARLLAQASHDIRQPIQSIGLFTACLRNSALDAEQQRMIDNIDHSLVNVGQLFGQLIDQYHLDQGPIQANAQPFDLHALLHTLARQNEAAARAAGAQLRVRATRQWAYSDPTLLARMVQNLISNAIKYAPGSRVLIGTRRRNGALALEVHDRGPGIDSHQLGRVFEEFYRNAPSAEVAGHGLGMAIVQRLASVLGLGLRVRSQPGRGTAVVLEGLPGAPAQGGFDLLAGLRVGWAGEAGLVGVEALLRKWGCVLVAPGGPCDVRVASVADPASPLPQVLLGAQPTPGLRATYLALPLNPAELRSVLLAIRSAPRAVTGS